MPVLWADSSLIPARLLWIDRLSISHIMPGTDELAMLYMRAQRNEATPVRTTKYLSVRSSADW